MISKQNYHPVFPMFIRVVTYGQVRLSARPSRTSDDGRWWFSDVAPCRATRPVQLQQSSINQPTDLFLRLSITWSIPIKRCLWFWLINRLQGHLHPASASAWSNFLDIFFFHKKKNVKIKEKAPNSVFQLAASRPWRGFTSSLFVCAGFKRCPWCWKAQWASSAQRHHVQPGLDSTFNWFWFFSLLLHFQNIKFCFWTYFAYFSKEEEKSWPQLE